MEGGYLARSQPVGTERACPDRLTSEPDWEGFVLLSLESGLGSAVCLVLEGLEPSPWTRAVTLVRLP